MRARFLAGLAALCASVAVVACGGSDSGGAPDAPPATENVLLREFDGQSPNGTWSRMEPRSLDFGFSATADSLVMMADSTGNQHLVRDGLTVDSTRPYFVEVSFTIASPISNPSSFAVNFHQDGPDGDTSPVNCWTLNLDLGDSEVGGTIKYMGFANGGFRSIGQAHSAVG